MVILDDWVDLVFLTYHGEYIRVVNGTVLWISFLHVFPEQCSGTSHPEICTEHVHKHASSYVNCLYLFKEKLRLNVHWFACLIVNRVFWKFPK